MKSLPRILTTLLLAAAWIIALVAYPHMPEQVASHFDAAGNVNGYMGRFWGTFFLPVLLSVLYLVLIAIPVIDPKRANIAKFKTAYNWFVTVFFVFMLMVFGGVLSQNLGYAIPIRYTLNPGIALMFASIAFLLQKTEPNYSIGIRTPWTLANDTVWKDTHVFGSRAFGVAAVLAFIGTFFPAQAVWFVLYPVLIAAGAVFLFSYIRYRQVVKN